MKRACGLFLVVLAGALGGCGSSDSAPDPETTAAVQSQPSVPPIVEEVEQRLKAAGIPAKATALYNGEAEIEVQGAEIVYYADPSEAAKEAEGLLQVSTGHPEKAMADAYGQVIVWIANEQPLTDAQRARFEEVSDAVDPS